MQIPDFAPLSSRDLGPVFWTPERLDRQSAWWGHVPFAFWLVENTEPRLLVELGTHHGVSYASFCEAILRLRRATRCYAVDTWTGDPHAGAYDEVVYADLKDFHDKRYASFSQLIRSTFDEASTHFTDGTIDLLHIDGYHTYDAVRHDFDTWRPKLSDRAVVLFHDTNERERNFGVWRLLDELGREAPVFEFLHAHGLGVVAVGAKAPEAIRRLCTLADGAQIAAVRERFSFLGARWIAMGENADLRAQARALEEAIGQRDAHARELEEAIGQQDARARALEEAIGQQDARARALEEAIGQKDARGRFLEDEIAKKDSKLIDLQSSLAKARKQSEALSRQVQRLERDLDEAGEAAEAVTESSHHAYEEIVHLLAGLKRSNFNGGLPTRLSAWRWLGPGRWKKRQKLAEEYRLIAASPLFDSQWYRARNPDVALKAEDPILHYLTYGAREGRSPGPLFDGAQYLKANPDVANAEENPLLHYVRSGCAEKRPIPSAWDDLTQAKRRRWDRVAEAAGAAPPLDALTVQLRHGKALYLKRCELAVFKARTEGPICFSACEAPFFSIVICAFNKFIYNIRVMELLEHALSYTRARSGLGIEIIFIDDGSTDDTSRLEDHVKGVVFRRVSPNIGFLRACNFGASLAKGEYLVFLNNDIEFAPDIFLRLYDAIERDKAEVACFGGEILQFNGSIQDFGSGIWRDGVAQGYFRNEPPTRYAYAYPRDVDYVAGCFFCISAAEFRDFNGFDDCFAPGYYEEADLSLRLWKAGRRSRVYPDIRVYHLEYGSFSSEASHGSLELMARNRPLFASRHRELLDQRREIKPDAGFHLQHSSGRPRVLFIEDRVPALRLGTGYGRAEIIVRALAKKADVDILSIFPKDDEALPDGFEYFDISYGPDVEFLQQRLSSRRYDVVYICRPHNLAAYADVLRAWKRGGGAIVYDTEAIFAVREVARAEAAESYAAITGSARFADLLENELRPAEIADAIVAVSDAETAILRRQFNRPVLTIGHHLPLRSLGRDPTARSGLLFVGSLRGVDSPNYDSLVWFLDRVWPRIRANRQGETLRIAGFVEPGTSLQSLQREGVTCLGPVADLTAEYERARVFIAPTRFAAGLPFKVGEALSYGLPVVSSVLVSEQLAQDGKTIGGVAAATVRDDGKAFAEACLRLLEDDDLWLEMQREAVKHMETCCAPSALGAAIDALLRELRETPRAAVDPERDLRSHDESRTINLEEWREEVVLSDSTSPNLARPIGIFVHLYYEDLAQEVAGYLALIELPKRIYVSTDTEEKREIVVRAFERSGLGPATEIAIVPNCGYDVAPFIVHFLNKIADHDICLKIHGKRSASERMEFGQRWRTLLFQDLIGDQERVRRIVNTILANPDLGVLMAQHYYRIEACVNIGLNYPSMRNILGRLGIDLRPDQKIEFPTASMFWFRSEALAGLAALGLKWSDFEGDGPQKDGTLAHAIERCFLFSGASAGKRWGFLPLYRTGPKIPRDEFVRRIRSSGAFDEEYYKKANPDVAAAGVNPFEHWINVGAREAREPSDPRHVNPEVYRYLEHHYRGLPLEGNKSSKSPWALRVFERSKSRTEPRGRATSPHFSPLKPSDPSTRYEELAPKASFAPIPPSFVFGPFPEFLTQAYFADVTALSVGCYTLNNVGVTSHSLLVRDGALLTCAQLNLSQESITEAAAYGKLCANVEFSRVLDEPVVSLAGPGHLVYGHWLVDFLPKLYVLHRSGINPFAAKYLLPSNTPEFATSWLQMLGISASQLIFFEPYAEVVGAAHLFVPTLLRTNGRTHPLFRSAIEYLLSLLPCKGEPGSVTGRGARLYLSRGGPGRENRKLLNRQAIESVAAEAGYAVVRPETLSIAEQLTMFARAKTIVGEYGSALHGSLFAQPGTMVCALRASARHPGFLQSGLCQAMEQQIGYVFGQAGEHDVEQEFTIREDDFKTALGLIDIC